LSEFTLHPQLAADCHQLGRLPATRLLLHGNASLPWLILVPETEQLEFLLLPDAEQQRLLGYARQLASYLLAERQCQRSNFAAIGNLVPQMHLHIVGRHPGDPCWPAPVWGNLTEDAAYSREQLTEMVEQLQQRLPELQLEAL